MFMHIFILTTCTFFYCMAIPPAALKLLIAGGPSGSHSEEPVAIISQDSQVDPEGSFHWSYESADGTKAEQTGEVKAIDKEVVEKVVGSYSYQDPEGKTHEVHYVADENGFQPSGNDIAPEIIRNVEYIVSHPQPIQTEEHT